MKDDVHSYLKAQAHGIHINLGTEDKLNQLKEQFCNYYCPSKTGIEDYNGDELDRAFVCYICPIDEYINFIRDEL